MLQLGEVLVVSHKRVGDVALLIGFPGLLGSHGKTAKVVNYHGYNSFPEKW